jgi:hypothetical protein
MPNTSLAVDGSVRTLIWVDVIPSTGVTVGVSAAGSGSGVSKGLAVAEGGNVAVMT